MAYRYYLIFLLAFCLSHPHSVLVAQNLPYNAVNLGNWLLAEGWMKTSLFDGITSKDLLDGTQVQLMSPKFQKYLTAENGGGAAIVANRGSASGWETFRLENHGRGNKLAAVSNSPGNPDAFRIVRNKNDPNKIRIHASNGQFLQVRSESTNGYSLDRAPQVMHDHWNTYITEDDFRFMSEIGLTAVRIPVGWWIAQDPNPPKPFVGGSSASLDNAFTWARNHRMKVIVDLHAVEGSQNGNDHSGTRDGYTEWGDSYIPKTVAVIDFFPKRYGNRPSLGGIELMNEPLGVNLDSLKNYYKQAYDAVRKYSSSAYVIMSNPLDADSKVLLSFAGGFNRLVLDVHYYNLYSGYFNGLNVQQNINYIRNERAKDLSGVSSTKSLSFVGEWTAEWSVQGASKGDYRRYAQAQVGVYSRATFGWAYWAYKCQYQHWSLKWTIENGYTKL